MSYRRPLQTTYQGADDGGSIEVGVVTSGSVAGKTRLDELALPFRQKLGLARDCTNIRKVCLSASCGRKKCEEKLTSRQPKPDCSGDDQADDTSDGKHPPQAIAKECQRKNIDKSEEERSLPACHASAVDEREAPC